MKYRTRPIEIEDAIQYTGNVKAIEMFTNGQIVGDGGLFLQTDEGYIPVLMNDWIIKAKDGTYGCVRASLFPFLYEKVDD